MHRRLVLLAGLLVLAGATIAGCGAEGAASPEPDLALGGGMASGELPATVGASPVDEPFPGAALLSEGEQLRYVEPEPSFFVITDEGAWADFWQVYAPEGQTEAPSVDFETAFVLVGVQGAKNTDGYDIGFSALEQSGSEVRVVTDLREPAAGEQAESTLTQPYTIVQVDASQLTAHGPLDFVFETDEGERLGQTTTIVGSELDRTFPGATILAHGQQLTYEDPHPRFFVLTGDDAWADFWRTYAPDGQTVGPSVDWRRSFVLAGIQGAKSTGGYGISFVDLEQSGDEVHVTASLEEPRPGESTEMMFTQPYIVVQVESRLVAARGPLTFVFEDEAGNVLGSIVQTISPNPELEPVGEMPVTSPRPAEPFPGAALVAQGLQLNYDEPEPRFLVFGDEAAWTAFWKTYRPEGGRTGPSVDFASKFVLVGLQGNKSTGGYGITFTSLEQMGQEIYVVTGLAEPEAGSIVEPTFTQPYVIVQVDRAQVAGWASLTFVFRTEAGEELGRVVQGSSP